MEDKEKLDALIVQIKKLLTLTEEIYERDIYPVSFFSRAYDIAGRVQEALRELEIEQIALFEARIKAHQAQILSTVPPLEKKQEEAEQPVEHAGTQVSGTVLPSFPPPPPPVPEPASVAAAPAVEKAVPDAHGQEETPRTPPPPPTVAAPPGAGTKGDASRQNPAANMKKWLTLNDRFRFGRELFGGDMSLMDRTVAELNRINSYEKGAAYLKSSFGWDFEDEAVTGFLAIMEKCFSK
ncbi:MAG: hypothetical protein LBF85_06385 [Tannerella sp.]|jgi:hypothetical protein|nr:hypothetical protein [Tannerella sp.]